MVGLVAGLLASSFTIQWEAPEARLGDDGFGSWIAVPLVLEALPAGEAWARGATWIPDRSVVERGTPLALDARGSALLRLDPTARRHGARPIAWGLVAVAGWPSRVLVEIWGDSGVQLLRERFPGLVFASDPSSSRVRSLRGGGAR